MIKKLKKMQVKIKNNIPLKEILESTGSVLDGKYYYLPIWFEDNGDGEYDGGDTGIVTNSGVSVFPFSFGGLNISLSNSTTTYILVLSLNAGSTNDTEEFTLILSNIDYSGPVAGALSWSTGIDFCKNEIGSTGFLSVSVGSSSPTNKFVNTNKSMFSVGQFELGESKGYESN